MRKLLPVLLLVFLIGCTPGNSTDKAVEFNDFIIDQQDKINAKFEAFITAVDEGDSSGAYEALDAAISEAKASEKAVNDMEAMEGGTEFQNAAADLYGFYANSLDKDYRGIMPVLLADSATVEEMERSDAVLEAFTEQEDVYHGKLARLQKEFATKYDFILR